jgi:putative endonuclease
MTPWFVYILHCADNSLYTGITTDLQRRLQEHNGDTTSLGAKYTRARRPVEPVYIEQLASRAEASQRESSIKKLSRKQKQQLIREHQVNFKKFSAGLNGRASIEIT